MADCIERESAVKIAEKYGLTNGPVLGRHTGLADCIASEIASLPAADVAPVVLCKECQYAVTAWEGVYACTKPHHLVSGDHFCAFGERKDGGG